MKFDAPINATEASLQQVLDQASLPVVAVFWSPEDETQAKLDTVLSSTAQAYAGEVVVMKLNVRDAPQAQRRHDVESVPQFLFFRDGKLVARARGLPTAETLRPWIEYLLQRGPKPTTSKAARGDGPAVQEHPAHVTDGSFEETVLQSAVPVLVDFWAAWCGPCRSLAPVIDELARTYADRALVAKLDVDENPGTARRYHVMSIPTLILFHHGQEVDRVTGVQPKHVIEAKLRALL